MLSWIPWLWQWNRDLNAANPIEIDRVFSTCFIDADAVMANSIEVGEVFSTCFLYAGGVTSRTALQLDCIIRSDVVTLASVKVEP